MPVSFLNCVYRPASGAIAVGIVLKVSLEDGFDHDLGGSLNHTITNGWNAERTSPPITLYSPACNPTLISNPSVRTASRIAVAQRTPAAGAPNVASSPSPVVTSSFPRKAFSSFQAPQTPGTFQAGCRNIPGNKPKEFTIWSRHLSRDKRR